MSWKDLRIAKKLYVGFGAVLLLTAVVGFVAIDGFRTVDSKAQNAFDAAGMLVMAKDMGTSRRDFIMSQDTKHADKVKQLVSQIDAQITETKSRFKVDADKEAIEGARELTKTYLEAFNKYVDAVQTQKDDRKAMDEAAVRVQAAGENSRDRAAVQIVQAFQNCRIAAIKYMLDEDDKYIDEFKEHSSDIMRRHAGSSSSALDALRNYDKSFGDFSAAVKNRTQTGDQLATYAGQVISTFAKLQEEQQDKMKTAQTSATTLATIFAILAVVVGSGIAFFIARGVSRPIVNMAKAAEAIAVGDVQQNITIQQQDEIGQLANSFRNLIDYMKELAGAAEHIAAHDLTVSVEPKSSLDVLGKAFKTMATNLSDMIQQLGASARELVSAATEISSSAEQVSKGSKDQADQVNQVSTAIEEMTATILESSRNAGEASQTSKGASETALSGGQIVNDTIQGMQKIAQVVRDSAGSIAKLAQSADQIGEIIGVIDDIADQTNLLALNAAIEAARAGEQGRGFAVVADEVRKLAERTGKATGEITEMIKGIQKETGEAVHAMEAGIQEVDKGRELADKAGSSLTEIVAMAQRVTDMVGQIATAAEEQSSAAEQISKNIEHISSVTKESATGAEQSAAAAEELNRQAEGLQGMVGKFKLTV